jgi:hypothetical protein
MAWHLPFTSPLFPFPLINPLQVVTPTWDKYVPHINTFWNYVLSMSRLRHSVVTWHILRLMQTIASLICTFTFWKYTKILKYLFAVLSDLFSIYVSIKYGIHVPTEESVYQLSYVCLCSFFVKPSVQGLPKKGLTYYQGQAEKQNANKRAIRIPILTSTVHYTWFYFRKQKVAQVPVIFMGKYRKSWFRGNKLYFYLMQLFFSFFIPCLQFYFIHMNILLLELR